VSAPASYVSELVRCGECGERFTLSARRARAYRAEGQAPKCRQCRRPPIVLTEEERVRFRSWWLESSGLSQDELYEIAFGLS
jgi:hypothetical protein